MAEVFGDNDLFSEHPVVWKRIWASQRTNKSFINNLSAEGIFVHPCCYQAFIFFYSYFQSKQKVDSLHLQLQNLLYEVMHLKKEITKCLEFKWVKCSLKMFWKFLTTTPSFCVIILASFCGSDGELVASLDPESREPRLQPLPGVVLCYGKIIRFHNTSFSQEYRWVLGNYNGNFINTWKSSYGVTPYPEGEGILCFASCHWNHQDGLWQSWVTWLALTHEIWGFLHTFWVNLSCVVIFCEKIKFNLLLCLHSTEGCRKLLTEMWWNA